MAIKYKVVAHAQPGKIGGGLYKYYARITGRITKTLRDLSNELAMESTLSPIDIIAVQTALLEKIPQMLLNGHNVSLGDLGIFSVSISSSASDEPEKVSLNNINKLKVHFRPSNEFKQRLLNAKFEKAKIVD